MMRKSTAIILFLGLLGIQPIVAQSLNQAKVLYEKGEYKKAKPAFKKLLRQAPENGNYNLWYGVCCLRTGEAGKAIKPLETAVKKRVTSGQLFLAQAYNANYRFEEAIETYETYIKELNKRKRPTDEAEKQLEKAKANLRMLRGVEQVTVIDSFVVDKVNFLKAYHISPETGKLFMYNEYFKNTQATGGSVYETELANKIYYSEKQADGTLSILTRNKLITSWSKANLLPGSINESMNADYPFVMTDGVTIYYAADGPQSMGGYDIFVTRYNINSDSYLTPENVGMPFNSTANDYMYVIDDYADLGWFASDRYQPEGKVCVYLFIPNSSKQVYNYETMDKQQLIQLAQLSSIRLTQKNANEITAARNRLNSIESGDKQMDNYDFSFIINDENVYHHLADFQSPKAKAQYQKYNALEKTINGHQQKLEDLRKWYVKADKEEQTKLKPAILDLEKQILKLDSEAQSLMKEVRRLELQK